jgi:hypothetical protein
MSKTNEGEADGHPELPPIPPGELNQLHRNYQRAFELYTDAVSTINACVRSRSLPTAEQFARRRVAMMELMEARRSLARARRQRTLQ